MSWAERERENVKANEAKFSIGKCEWRMKGIRQGLFFFLRQGLFCTILAIISVGFNYF